MVELKAYRAEPGPGRSHCNQGLSAMATSERLHAQLISSAPCVFYSPVGQGQGPGAGGAVQGVSDLGFLAVGACFDREEAGGWTLVVQNRGLD